MFLVTGGAGFIGSNVVAALNDAGRSDVAVCDILGQDGKWRNLAKRQLADVVPPAEIGDWLKGRRLTAVIHLGAISETTATDGDLVIETNFRLSMRLLDWCTANATPFIYASSAATYGDGEQGFDDDASVEALKRLRPMNLYGWSKQLFDLAVAERAAKGKPLPPQWAGLKFFNVFGPNEYHKGPMMSVLARRFDVSGSWSSITKRVRLLCGIPTSVDFHLESCDPSQSGVYVARAMEDLESGGAFIVRIHMDEDDAARRTIGSANGNASARSACPRRRLEF